MRAFAIVSSALVLAACGSEVEPETVETPAEEADALEEAEEEFAEGESSYVSLDECETLSDDRDTGGTRELKCEGPQDYGVIVAESDVDVEISIIPPEGDAVPLELAAITDGGSNFLGRTIEWRGPEGGAPRALIMRHVVENGAMDPMGPDTSWLLVAKIGDPTCVVARVPPGPGQNVAARRFSDRDTMPDCLTTGVEAEEEAEAED